MSKYEALTNYLRAQPVSQLAMTFGGIETVIGAKLPPSAFKHRPWWSNNTGNSVMTQAWREAGWLSSDVDMDGRKLVFRRETAAPGDAPARRMAGGMSLVVESLSRDVIAALELKAEAAAVSVSEVARAILETHAKPSMAERLTLADRVRAASRVLRGVDVPAIVRADRDAR